MDLGILKTTFIIIKYIQVVLLLALTGLSIYGTLENVLYGLLSLVAILSLFAYLILFRVNITNEVVKQEKKAFVICFICAAVLVILSPDFLNLLKGNGTISKNNSEQYLDSISNHNANESFSYPIFKSLSKSEEPSKAIKKTSNTVNFDDELSNKKNRKDKMDSSKLIYYIVISLILLMTVFQFTLWSLAWFINSHPVDNLNFEVSFQNEEISTQPISPENENSQETLTQPISPENENSQEILTRPISPENENLQVQPDSDEDPSSVQNVIIHRKPRASEEIDTESCMENLDGVDYDSLAMAGPSMELGILQKENEESLHKSNLSSTAVTSKSDSFQQKSELNLPKVVITETSFQEELDK